MTQKPPLFALTDYAIGPSRSGQSVTLSPMSPGAANTLAPRIATFGPWAHYGATISPRADDLLSTGGGAFCYALWDGGTVAGVVVVRWPWLAGPYLQMLAILPEFQSSGLGACVLGWFEATARAAGQRNIWLCVTGINEGARRFYKRHGFVEVGCLPGLLRDGDDEWLMRKPLAASLA